MARNKVMKLWTVIVTAFLALCTALGLITTTASAAVQQSETSRNSESSPETTAPASSLRVHPQARSLPPTMKQRIRAEAHGTSPGCRQHPFADSGAAPADADCADAATAPDDATAPAGPLTGHRIPLQR
ncbi:hypothetical protein G3I38_32250 [Streptomyces sp. SID7958]|uniref:Secreted protein n=2 Tax=unclassified Streptomyces TaxID=2593676 RepID=A0A6G3QR67_9ACTN|nr:hypothetical protein [Streptomyces sp. SID14436]NEC83788.1 hypothetical protein [Streptomyces sp. SID7958]